MLWRIWQLGVAFAVMGSLAAQGELQNGYAIGFAGFLAAWIATAIPMWVIGRGPGRRFQWIPRANAQNVGLNRWFGEDEAARRNVPKRR